MLNTATENKTQKNNNSMYMYTCTTKKKFAEETNEMKHAVRDSTRNFAAAQALVWPENFREIVAGIVPRGTNSLASKKL